MYEKIEQLLDAETKGKNYVVVMWDFNAGLGEGKEDSYVGHYGWFNRHCKWDSHCWQMLVFFFQITQMYITKIWFTQDRRRRNVVDTCGRNLETGKYQRNDILTNGIVCVMQRLIQVPTLT